ncbi:MAG: NADP-dependent isocitrate dehydrogenase [Bradymonadaceae bacterium]
MSEDVEICVLRGDGIGPEIMDGTLRILDAAGAQLDCEEIEAGREVYERGITSGISPSAWRSIKDRRILLKAPITTPQGGGYKSLNVTLRKSLSLYANVRPCVAYDPVVSTPFPGMDVVVIRENEEDSYSGIEYRQSQEMTSALKFISRPGTERLVRFAFDYARRKGRDSVTCMTKDNILKVTDGLFHEVFEEVSAEYPDVEGQHLIIDIGTARVAANPVEFDVVVAPNLYGDILSDVTAELTGSVGLCGSANVGDDYALFEAIHGSAPDIAGEGIANPSGLIHGAIMMLEHIGQGDVATRVHNAWLAALEDGIHTPDIYNDSDSSKLAETDEFVEAVVARLGDEPDVFDPVEHPQRDRPHVADFEERVPPDGHEEKELVGVDVFVEWRDGTADELGEQLDDLGGRLELQMIANRGMKVWPDGHPETFCVDNWQCRFLAPDESIEPADVLALQNELLEAGFEPIKTENLYEFDGERGFTRGQGE